MKLVVKRSLFAGGGFGGVTHLLYAQQTRKVRGILASDILGELAKAWKRKVLLNQTRHPRV